MKETVYRVLLAAAGLAVAATGTYLMILANIGVAPWDTLNLGLSYHLPISYGTASVIVSLLVLITDLVLREPIGIGSVLDALLVGKMVDLLQWLRLFQAPKGIISGILVLVIGMFFVGLGQLIYMKAGLSYGPRDSLMVAVGRRMKRVPIGVANVALLTVVTLVGALLGGPIGIGTILAAFGLGAAMQIVFRIAHFEPRNIEQEDFIHTYRRMKVAAAHHS